MHPVETMKTKKRKSLEGDSKHAAPKRKRPSDPGAEVRGGDVIVIDSDTEESEKPPADPAQRVQYDEPDAGDVLKFFRVSLSSLT